MRFFHLSDLHLGIKLYEHDLLKDQKAILDEIVALTRQYQPDAVVFAGDIYDRSVPPVEAVALFDDFMTQLRAALPNGEIMLISGNHDSAQRLDVFRSELSDRGIHMIGNPPMQKGETIERVTLTDDFGAVNFYLLPFVRPGMVRFVTGTKENGDNLSYPEAFSRLLALSPLNPNERNVLVSHQFFLPDGGDAENIERAENEVKQVGNLDAIPASLIADFDYAALGHIHKPMKVGSETLRYCGTPMPYSLSEENQQKGILMVEMGAKGDVQTTVLPLHPVHQVRKLRATREALLSGASEDFVSICVTDAEAVEMVGLRELLRERYPNLLELRREREETVELAALQERTETLSPYELCLQFAGERLNAEEKSLLTEVMNAMKEENA
ncbi:MAG: metallophosphoesterase family protein [Christensenellales bacterium]